MRQYLLLLFIIISQLGNSQTYTGKQKEIQKILAQIEQFSKYVMASDHESIAKAYSKDGKLFPNNMEIIEGEEAIGDYWKLPEGIQISYHKIIPQEIKIVGKEAYDYGYYEGRTKKADGEEVSWKGKYVIVWKKVGKEWKIYLDIWNRIEE